jgi:AcrR family transcriptional regulator
VGGDLRFNTREKVKAVAGAAIEPPPAKRPVGRPRSEESGKAILAVTLKLLGERGYGGLTIDEIVAQARVSNSTIYRRWPTKEELVVAAFDLLPKMNVPDRGNLIAECLELARQYDRLLHRTPLASVVPALISEATHNPALAQRLESTFLRRRLTGRLIVMRAVERGDLPLDTDVELATELFWAPLVQRSLFASNLMDVQAFRQMFEVIRAGIWEVHRNALQTRQGTQASKPSKPSKPQPSLSRE